MYSRRAVQSGFLLVAAFVSFAFVGRATASRIKSKTREAVIPVNREALPRPGRQYVFVYIGSSRCGPSNSPGLAAQISQLIQLVNASASRDSVGFVTIGVAREISAASGLKHLLKVANFDEISAGQGVLNQASAHFLSVDHRGAAATPQIVVLERTLREIPGGVDASDFDETVLLRKVGTAEIANWAKMRAPLPRKRSLQTALVP